VLFLSDAVKPKNDGVEEDPKRRLSEESGDRWLQQWTNHMCRIWEQTSILNHRQL